MVNGVDTVFWPEMGCIIMIGIDLKVFPTNVFLTARRFAHSTHQIQPGRKHSWSRRPLGEIMETKHSIVIAEDHTILRDGLRAMLSFYPEFDVVGTAGDGLEAIRRVETLQPDLLLIDLSMPRMSGMDAIRDI